MLKEIRHAITGLFIEPTDPAIDAFVRQALKGNVEAIRVGTQIPQIADIYGDTARIRLFTQQLPDGTYIEHSFITEQDKAGQIRVTKEGIFISDSK